jgi:hypothetical protein
LSLICLFEGHDVIIAKCQCFESRYSEADVWNPIIAKPTCLKSYNSKFLDKHPARYLQLLETQLQVVLHISTPVSARKLTRKQWHCCTSEKTETLHTGSSPHITYRALQKEKNGATMIRQLSAVKVKTVCALRLQCLPNIAGAPLSSSPPDCRCQCSSSRRTLHMGSRPVLSIRSLQDHQRWDMKCVQIIARSEKKRLAAYLWKVNKCLNTNAFIRFP